MKNKDFQIRNSTADFLIFTKENSADTVDVRVKDENAWMTIESLAKLYSKGRSTISEYLKAIYADIEQDEKSTCRNFRQVASNGKDYQTKFYALEAIIAVGYRVNFQKATKFRQWATKVLKDRKKSLAISAISLIPH